MTNNYLKVALRVIRRQKGYSFINTVGLAIGMACCLLIMLWVQNELSFDRFHEKGNRIYRVIHELTLNNRVRTAPETSALLGPAATGSIPGVEQAVRVLPMGDTVVKWGGREFRERRILYADAEMLSVFSFPLVAGQAASALRAPYTAVVTETTARRYFGSASPLGKVLQLGSGLNYAVTGVMKDVPRNSHLTFDILCSFSSYVAENKIDAAYWGSMSVYTYVLLAPNTDSRSVLAKMSRILDENIGNKLKKINGGLKVFLQPLRDIRLRSNFESDMAETGDMATVILFCGIALFVLLIACINFVNLATARYAGRALEVGLRKTMGAGRGSLIAHFFAETLVVAALAAFLAFLLTALALPVLSAVSGQDFPRAILGQPVFLLGILIFTALVGILSGGYPALFLSSFSPAQTLKGDLRAGVAGTAFRRILVVGQFTVSIALIIGTLTVFRQIRFLRSKHLGFAKEQVMVLPLPLQTAMTPVTARDEFAAISGISAAALSSNVPGLGIDMINYTPQELSESESVLMQTLSADDRFLGTLGMVLVKGRNFSPDRMTDSQEAVLINETAAAILGWPDPLGKTLTRTAFNSQGESISLVTKIVGVVRDFHTLSLHKKIEPLVINNYQGNFRWFSLRFAGQRLPGVMAAVKAVSQRLFPAAGFDPIFLDETFGRMYQAEERLNRIFTSFAVLAVFISCLGLFGLAAFVTERRTKEMGIRKVLGASVSGIVILLSREFSAWVLVANLISWPMAYFFLARWLQGFAYRADLGAGVFIASGLLAMAIAWLTVGVQAFRAARANPVDSLKYE
jgi:putative ABC transport system permease protein